MGFLAKLRAAFRMEEPQKDDEPGRDTKGAPAKALPPKRKPRGRVDERDLDT